MKSDEEKSAKPLQIEIPFKTYLKTFVAFIVAFFLIQLAPLLLLLFLSLLIGMTLTSVEKFLVSKGWKKVLADAFLILGLIGTLSIIIFYVIPQALSQMKELIKHLPELQAEFSQMAPHSIKQSADKLMTGSPDSMNKIWNQIAIVANHTLTSIFEFIMMLIVSIYMLLDGRRAYAWILAFFSEGHRKRIDDTATEIGPIVEAYIIGQATTSTIAAIWVFCFAHYLNIPGAITLAVLAAIFDILPGIGFILNVVTAGLLALTVSSHTALMMVLAIMVYSALENYVLIPHIYGNRMKLSPLVVLLSLIVSGSIAGIPGMIAILPIVAAYEPIERRWLKRHYGLEETVKLHRDIANQEN